MGMGRYRDGKFDLVVVANFTMSATDWTEWRRSFEKASELFWNASEGQMQFGRIFVCDDSIGLDAAEIILHASGDPSYGTWGEFGQPGAALHLMPYVRFQVLTHHHEMGHHVWALGEEYAADAVLEEMDVAVVPPDNATIPLVGSAYADGDLVGADAIVKFGALIERRGITANTATSLTVNPPFSQPATDDTDGWVQYQFPAECATDAAADFCIMENSRGAAGTLNADGTWTPAANPVTEFCTDGNHDADGDTQQESRNADSCWETIVSRDGFTTLVLPDPAAPGPAAGATVPDWIVLEKQLRFAVVVDRSGSMSQGHKMADARHGAVYWLEFCAVDDDLLSIVAYDDLIDPILGLVQVSTLGGLAATTAAIDALDPRGATNIRDALFEARDQIESLGTRAAVQVALLLTDGKHNTPSGSSPLEALPDYQEGGIRLYTLGVGAPGAVDMDVLDELAVGTGGRSFMVGDDQAGVIEAAMVEINAEVRGGIITTEPVLFPDAKASALDKLLKPLLERRKGRIAPKSRPKLREVLDVLRVRDAADLLTTRKRASARAVAIPVHVEPKADRASFAVVHPDSVDVWLYLVDPAGNVTGAGTPGVSHVESPAPHEFIVVDAPAPGRWLLVVVRTRPGAAFTARAVAGGENRNLQVFASAPPYTPKADVVRLRASARWRQELTGLRVTAEVTAPSGARTRITLHDEEPGRPGSGRYEGIYSASEVGRHRAVVTFVGSPAATIADAVRLLLHTDARSLDVDAKAPRFLRQVVVSFDVASSRKVADGKAEKPARKGPNRGRPRPKPLVSAKHRPRVG